MDLPAGEMNKVRGQCGDERLSFTGCHLGDLAVVEHVSTDKLDVEVPHLNIPAGHFTHNGEGLRENIFGLGTFFQFGLELGRPGLERIVIESLNIGFEPGSLQRNGHVGLYQPLITRAEYLY